jgi:hypothetical protein
VNRNSVATARDRTEKHHAQLVACGTRELGTVRGTGGRETYRSVAGREIEAQLEVLNGPSPVFGGPHNTTTMSLCAVGPERKSVQEVG